MSARETHVTEWGLYMLATRPPSDPLTSLWSYEIDEMTRAGYLANYAACADLRIVESEHIGFHLTRTTVPTCPRCAVLRDEALEGRLPKRKDAA